ncbi:hypothetical protein F4810DRAFT_649501 [Camillea tinctor]|nr:hypothetical protein F4810DRAFT_649501 [Camillea tinctor]
MKKNKARRRARSRYTSVNFPTHLQVSMPNEEWSPLKKSKHRRNSFAAESPSAPEVSEQPAWRHSLDDYHPVSSAETGDGWDFLRRSKEVVQHESGAWGSPAYPKPTVEDVAENPKETTESLYDMRSVRTAVTGGQDTPKLNRSNGDSTPYEDLPSPSFSQFKESLGTMRSSARWDSHMSSISSTRRPRRRRSLSGVFPDEDEEPPDRRRDSLDASSIVSDSTFYTGHISTTRSRCPGDDLDDADSVASAPAQDRYDIRRPKLANTDKRNGKGLDLFNRFKSSIGIAEKERSSVRKPEEDGKNSFLAKAGTLGAGAGLADTVIAVASQASGSKATDAPSEKEAPSVPITPERRLSSSHLIDPEIVEREIRPAIDPQYGDLLPLPPTTPGTPVPELGDDIPPLPESRPGTPESDLERRLRSGKSSHVRRRSDNAVRARTPSQSAIPIHFRLKTTPTSPGNLKSSSALTSPTTVSPEYESPSRTRARPPSRDNTKAVKPLLLVQKASRELIEVSGQAQEESIASRELMHDRTLQALEERNDTNFSQIPMLSDESIQSPEIVPSTAQAVPDNEELAATSEADNVPDSPSDVFHDLPIISAYKETPDTDKIPTTIPHQSVELPQVEVHQADDSDLQEAMVNFMSSPQLPPWELVAPIGNLSPVPEPFDPMSKDRSSDLFQSSPSTHKFSDFDISEGRPSSEPAQEGTETGSITEHVSGDNMQDTSILVATATSGVTDELIASSIHDKQDHSEQFGKREGIGSNESKHVISSTSDFEAEANLSDPIDNIGSHERNIQDNDADQSGSVSTQKLEEVREELSDIDDEIDALSSKASQAPRELPLGPRASMWSGALPPAGLPSWSGAVYMLKGVPPRWSLGTPRRESLPQTALPSSKEDEDEEQPQTSSSIIHADIASSSLASSPVFETDQEQFFDAIADHVPSKQDVEEVIATNVSLEEANPDGTELEAGDLDAATADQDPGATPKKSESPQYQTTEPTTDEQTTLVTPQELTLAGHLIELLDQPTAKHADAAAPLAEPTQSIEQALLEEKAQKFPMETEVILQDQPGTSVPQESVSAEVESIDSVVTMERSKENEKKTETQEPNAEHGLQVTDVRDPTLEQQDSSLAQDEPFIQSPRDNEAPHQPAISRPSSPPARGKVSPEDTVDYSEAELQQSGVENHLVESSTDILAGSDGTLEPTENAGNDGQDISLEEVSAISHPPVQGEPALKSQFDSKLESESALGNELLSSDILSQDNKVVESTILENIEAKSDMEVSQTIAAIEPSLQVGNSQISESRSLEQADVEEQLWQPNIGGEPQTELHAARSDPHPHSDPQTESAPAENLHDNAPLYVEAVDNLLTSQTTTDEIAPTFPDPSSTEKTDAGNPVIEEPVIEQSNTEAVVTEQPATEELFTQAPVIEVPTITVSSVDEPSLNEPAADETLTEAHVTEKPIANESAIGAATPEEHAVEESIGVESHKDIESLADELTSKSAAQEDKKQRETALRSLHVEQAQVPSIANPSTYEPLSETSNTSEQLIDAVVVGDSAEMIVQTPTEPAMGDVWFEPIGSSMTSGSEEKSKAVTLDSGVEPMRIVEEAKPVEEPNPVEPTEPDSELEGTETVVTGLESTGEAESKPIERPTATEEGHNPVDEIRGAEGPKLVEELTLVEDPILSEASTATKEPKLAEEPTLVEEPQPAEERKLVEELTLVEDPDLPTEKSYDIQSSNEASGNTAQDPPQEHFLGHPVGEDLPLEPASPGKKSKKKKKKKSKARQSSDTSTLGVADPSKSVDEPITVESNDAVGQQDIPVSLFSSSETASASANQTMDKEPLKLDLQPNTIDANELKSLPSDPVGADVPTVNEVPIIAETITIDDSHTTPEAPLVSVASGANDPITCDVPVASDHIVTSDVPTTQDTTATEEAVVGTGSTMTNPSVAVIEDPITHEGYIPDVAAAGEVPSTTENPVANENPVTSESRTTDDAPVLSNVPVLSEISGTEETKKRSDTDDTIISEPSREVLESSKEREGLDVEVPGLEASVIDNEPYEIEERVNDDAISIPTYERQAPNEDENSSLLLDTDIAVAYSHSGRSQEVSHDEDEGPGYSITSPIIDKGKEDETLHQSVPHAETVEPIRGLEITRDHPDESSTADQLVQSSRAEDSVIEDGVLTKQVPIPQDEINESHETSDVHVLNDSIVSPGDAVITQRTPSTSIPLETMETSTSTPESIELPPVSRSQTDLGQESTDMPETRNLEQMAAGEMNTRDEGPLESILEDTVPVLTEVDPSDHSSPDVIDSARSNTDASRRSDSEITPDAQAPTEANDSVEESGEGGQSKTDNRDTEVHQDLEKPTAEITGADYSSEQEEVTTPKLFDDESKTPGPPSTRYDEGDVELPIIPEADEPTNDAILVPVSSTSDKIAIVTAEGEQDNKEGHAGHIEGEPAPESSSQPEFQTLPQVTVESTGDVHPDSTSARSHGSHSLEDDTSADLPDQKQISASNEVTPLYVPESASLTEGLSTERPVNPVEHKTVREPSPTTDVLKVGPVDVEGVTTTPALSEPMVGVIPRQIISSSPMENKADGAIPSQEPHVTPSQEQQDVLLPQDLAVTQLNEQPEVTPDTLFPDGYDVPLPEETQPNELAEPAEVTKEICDQASPKSQDTAPVQSEEPPHHHLDEQPIDSAKELGYDSPSGQGPKSETVVQADDSSSQPLQPNTDLAEPHQEVHEDTTAGEPAQASQSLEPVEHPSPQASLRKKSKKKKKRKSQVEPEPEHHHQLENIDQLQGSQEPQPSSEEPPVSEKEPELQHTAESASAVVQDEAIPEDINPQASPSKKSKKKKKKRASQASLEAEQEHGTSSESQLVQPTLAEGPRAEESTMKGISSEDPFLDMPPIAETSMQVFPVREATPERFPLEEPKQEIASPIKLEEPAGLTKAPESQGALLLDQSKNETSAQETTQSGPRENAHEAEETPTQKLVVQDDLRQSYDQLKADQQPVEEKGSPRDIDSKIAPAKELESEEQATDKPSTSDIATPEPAPTVPGEDSQATSSNAPKDTDQTAEPIPELVSGHPKLGDSQDFDLDREIIGTTSEHSSEANKQHGSLATSQPEDMVEDVSTEQGKKVGTSIETPQNYADDSPELPLMLSKDENKKSDTEVKPDLLLDTQVSSVQDRSFISVAAQPIAHTPEGIDATDNQAPEPRERESAGTENEHQSTQSNQTQVVMQLPIRTISPEVISEGKELKNDDLMEDETSPKVQDVAELASPKGLSGGHKEGQDEDREITKNEAHDEEDNIDYSTLREKWERKTRNDEPATETPRKTILDTLNIESPVLARETIRKLFESRGHIPGLPGLPKRKEPETSEVVQERDNLDMSEEQKPDSPSKGVHLPSMSVPTTPNFGRHSPGNLAPVEEETKEELESESPSRPWGITRRFTDGRTMSRDSGVAMDALWPLRLNLVNELAKRDSGVHVREEPESTETKQEEDYTKVEENDTQVRSGSGSQDEARQPSRPSTPKPDAKEVQEEVQEEAQPSENKIPAPSTPIRRKEPIEEKEKAKSTNELAVKKTRQSKSADQLVPSEPLMAMAATTTLSRQDQRSASEKVARDANASPILGKQPRRSASNTSLSRLRTPEPLTFWPEGSGSYARTNTPPLRRRAKRMSGDLRSLGQPTTEDPNLPSSKDLSPDRQALDNTTPIANEGRVRARDMTDVYVS